MSKIRVSSEEKIKSKTTAMSDQLWEAVKDAAWLERITTSEFIRRAINEKLEREENK